MPSKAEFYRQMAEQVSIQHVGSWNECTAFLTYAARNYKYASNHPLIIYAHHHDAPPSTESDPWSDQRRGRLRPGDTDNARVTNSGASPRVREHAD